MPNHLSDEKPQILKQEYVVFYTKKLNLINDRSVTVRYWSSKTQTLCPSLIDEESLSFAFYRFGHDHGMMNYLTYFRRML